MKKQKKHIVSRVISGSIAEEMEIEPGDELISINDQPVGDILDYHYLCNEEYLTAVIRKPDGEEWELEIEKEFEEDLGMEFENGMMDEYHSCHNKCIFCFIDQMPPGMRNTLYFKDDDSRLSFLQGNYITLTNLKEEDIQQIIRYHLSPINISFQTMNPQLRCKMLNNRFAGEALKKVDRFIEAGIELNGQIVLCKGVNDGAELEYTIEQLTRYLPNLVSVSVVPVGLTKFRDGLYPLEPFEKEDAIEVLDIIHKWQERIMEKYHTHMIHASDEWYLLAGRDLPEEDNYDGYPQLENGVGMIRLFMNEVKEELAHRKGDDRCHTVSIATGLLAGDYIRWAAEEVRTLYPNVTVRVYPIKNDFFGEKITVAGLLTGQDLEAQLKGKELGERLFLSSNVLRDGENVFLDDMTVEDLERSLQTKTGIVKSDGKDFVHAILLEDSSSGREKQPYEVKDYE